MNNFKTMKVFDCQWDPGMPKKTKKAFFDICEVGNDVFVEWTIETSGTDDLTEDYNADHKLVDQWLIENGAEGPKDKDSSGEKVLIKHWW